MKLNFNGDSLIPAVIQDANSSQVLMVAWMNEQALTLTYETGEVHFWSRSRHSIWHKGETSGNYLIVQEILVDCDTDTLLLRVIPNGPTCHTGAVSCFHRTLEKWDA